jgi:hypothetical protein
MVVSRSLLLFSFCIFLNCFSICSAGADPVQNSDVKVDPSPIPAPSFSPDPTPSPSLTPTPIFTQEVATPTVTIMPTPEPTEPFHIELDFTTISYDNIWQTGGGTTESAHNILTSPEDFSLRVLVDKWLIQGRYFSNQTATNGDTINDQSYSDFAVAYEVGHGLHLGLWGSFERSSLNDVIDQEYSFGPFVRMIFPLSRNTDLEVQGGVGPDIESVTADSVESQISFGANESVYLTVRIAKGIRLLFGGDAWQKAGSLTSGGASSNQLNTDIYRLRIVPIGLRLQF